MKQIEGKVALVTGASMGIGAAVSGEMARQGCRLALVARGREGLEKVVDEIRAAGGQAQAFPCDMDDAEAVARTIAKIVLENNIHPMTDGQFLGLRPHTDVVASEAA